MFGSCSIVVNVVLRFNIHMCQVYDLSSCENFLQILNQIELKLQLTSSDIHNVDLVSFISIDAKGVLQK